MAFEYASARYLHADERGSITAISNGSGVPIGVNSYDDHGMPATGNIGRYGYTGQMWLVETGSAPGGLYHYKARAYSPRLGRFLQTDPIGMAGGMNLYDYPGSDPVNKTDPSGLVDYDIVVNGYNRGFGDFSDDFIFSYHSPFKDSLYGNWTLYGSIVALGLGSSPAPADDNTVVVTAQKQKITAASLNPIVLASQGAVIAGLAGAPGTGVPQNDDIIVTGQRIRAQEPSARPSIMMISQSPWSFWLGKSAQKWKRQLEARGWTEAQIDEATAKGKNYPAVNNINPMHGATRYVNPQTGQSVVLDDVTGEVIHV